MGLYALQHRGQESVGVVSIDAGGAAAAFRRMGTMTDSMAQDMERSPGVAAIGHTRYSTSGSSSIENAQPMMARSRGGTIALAHNGNIVNAGELRVELEEQGSIFASTNDSEVIVHRLAKSTAVKPEDRIADALRGVEGAYSLIIGLGNTLMAVRDPRGWRPLCMGKLGDLRARHRRRVLRARRRAGRGHRRRRRGDALDASSSEKGIEELRLRVRLLRASRQPGLRRIGRPRPTRARTSSRHRASRQGRGSRVQRTRLVELAPSFSRRRPVGTPR
jgi:hypothetical protein